MSKTFWNPNTHLLEDGKGNTFREGERVSILPFEDIPMVKEAYIQEIWSDMVSLHAWIDDVCEYVEIYSENFELVIKHGKIPDIKEQKCFIGEVR